ncbi:flagellar biosynthetic protein FliO [Salidesulfovibrio onnuriiensis]|uniref:flagellar biosynthetic protein FliO n=1 Tax=Salidesulfovibrio onnuriiensis TaxID=2583823 RepID=UPI00202AE6CD|nr:flagellar biosynthetic protein FliO [Salidesulfovibrio onnuriiensis]
MDSTAFSANATAAAPLGDAGIGSVFSTAGYLCLILGVIFLAYWLLRRYGPYGATPARGGSHNPRLLGRLLLGNRQSVTVVRYRDKTLVLGVTEERISLLTELEGEEEEEEDGSLSMNFASLLKRNVDGSDS